ncbi:MAG: hypothetical protein WCG44_01375 [bacterium]
MKNEHNFIEELEKKAKVQHRLVETEVMPEWAKGLGLWLAVNPWRVLIPLSAILYVLLRMTLGLGMVEKVLELFGGFR